MIHLTIFINILSLCTGSFALAVSLLFYQQFRKRVILSFTGMLVIVMLLVINRTLELYGSACSLPSMRILAMLSLCIEKGAFLLGILIGPQFCFQLIGFKPSRGMVLFFRTAAVIYTVSALIESIAAGSPSATIVRNSIGLPLLFGTYLFLCSIAASKLESLGNIFLNRSLKLFFALSLLLLPAALVKYIRSEPYLPFHLENSLSLLLVTLSGIFFAFRYFNQPLYFQKGELSAYFRSRFTTTSREEEIILTTLQGMSNSEIADKLCISVRTVESHLYNIFQKTGVKNRTQLTNLIRSNSTD